MVRTAASWVDSFASVAVLCELGSTARAWIPGPQDATMNAYAACLADHVGACTVNTPRQASHAFCTPAVLVDLVERADLPPLVLVVAGDRLAPRLVDRAEAHGHTVHHYYGAAQLSFVGWGRDADSLRPFPRVRAECRAGELWVSSPWLCSTEEGDPVARREVRDGEIWMSVGDRGEVLTDGRIRVAGRADAVTTGGATVLLADVEDTLRPYALGELVVLGRAHPRLGQIVLAVCTDPADLLSLPVVARRELAPSHRPRAWSLTDRLPLTRHHKIDRAAQLVLP
ncbi:MAG: AMP-binding protein [Microlunatus sp.]|nr:AMP-binding protein [Microlunatus sp.]